MANTTEFKVEETDIPGLMIISNPVIKDTRGYFQEKFQKAKLVEAGLSGDFQVVQSNISYNAQAGVLRGLHAEPWDKYISVVTGKIFCAYIDLRQGQTFGKIFTAELDNEKAVFLPKGVANSFLTLEPCHYIYYTNAHWSLEAKYTLVTPVDSDLGIDWPIPISECIISEKDLNHPKLKDIEPMRFE